MKINYIIILEQWQWKQFYTDRAKIMACGEMFADH